jgi:hypothetical protein|tara:strand:- start:1035 stop:1364 length:330 start_codon:yes stop_codon:yes gene_type:complete
MAITYKYTIDRIRTAPTLYDLTNVVTEVDYTYEASEGTGSDKVTADISAVALLGQPDSENFIALENLTEANVREFVKAVVNVDGNKKRLQRILEEKKVPKAVKTDLPWA